MDFAFGRCAIQGELHFVGVHFISLRGAVSAVQRCFSRQRKPWGLQTMEGLMLDLNGRKSFYKVPFPPIKAWASRPDRGRLQLISNP
jgi:hypothetical protein